MTRRNHLLLPLILLVSVSVLSSACVATSQPQRQRGATVEVENRSPDAVRVTMVRSGTPIPLGRVEGMARRRFVINRAALGSGGHLMLNAASARMQLSSAAFDAVSGDRVLWVVHAGLRHSALSVR